MNFSQHHPKIEMLVFSAKQTKGTRSERAMSVMEEYASRR